MTQMTDVTIHIDETLEPARIEQLRDVLLKENGVMAAVHHKEKAHLMIVEYDPQRTNSQNLLTKVRSQGIHAELIGM